MPATAAGNSALAFFGKKAYKPRTKAASAARPAVPARTEEDEDREMMRRPPPSGPFTEYKLLSSGGQNNMIYDVMRFDARKPVPFDAWTGPIHLNRKNPPARELDEAPKAGKITPMLGLDGGYVYGPDGNIVMMQDGRPVVAKKEGGDGDEEDVKPVVRDPKKRKPFQKKTKQIHIIPEERRQTKKEERFPWVLEDGTGGETWIGRLDADDKTDNHAFLVTYPGDNNFYFLPAHKWYKLQKRNNNLRVLDHEEVEAEFTRRQKNPHGNQWVQRVAAARAAVAAAEDAGQPIDLGHIPHRASLVHTLAASSAPLSGRLKTVTKGQDEDDDALFGDDDEDTKQYNLKKREVELGQEGDLDEYEHHSDFSDDEEEAQMDDGPEDLDQKESKDRIRKMQRRANILHETGWDEDDFDALDLLEMIDPQRFVSRSSKGVHKALRTHEGGTYDSDEDKNPYLTDEEEEEEEEIIGPSGVDKSSNSRPPPPLPPSAKPGPRPGASKLPSKSNGATPSRSRATSPPAPRGSGVRSGSSFVAQRATSPKGKSLGSSSRATSPTPGRHGERATSPLAGGAGTRAASPLPRLAGQKRKAEDADAPPQPKKAKVSPVAEKDRVPITKALVVDYLRGQAAAPTTSECVNYFKKYLYSDPKRKTDLANIIKVVAELRTGVLHLRSQFR